MYHLISKNREYTLVVLNCDFVSHSLYDVPLLRAHMVENVWCRWNGQGYKVGCSKAVILDTSPHIFGSLEI